MTQSIKDFFKKADLAMFGKPGGNDILSNVMVFVSLLFLFTVGIAHWYFFMNRGNIPYSAFDWPMNFINYSVIQQALGTDTIPYHISRPFLNITNRFFAIVEVSLSPQVLLLKHISLSSYFLFNSIFMYTIGFIGCIVIKRKFGLSVFSFLILFLLFNFNGYITSHIAVAHTGWFGYFLLPYFFLGVFELSDKDNRFYRTFWKLPIVLLLIFLQGTIHIFVGCILFLVLYAVFNRSLVKQVLIISAVCFAVSFFRVLPGAITFFHQEHSFMTGYPNLAVLIDSAINIHDFTYRWIGPSLKTLGWWEFDMYIDIVGLLIILYFGVIARFSKAFAPFNARFKEFDYTMLLFVFFSFNYVYYFVRLLPIPFIHSERVMSRLIVMPFLLLLIISSVRIQKALDHLKIRPVFKFVSLAAVFVMGLSLAIHSRAWSLAHIADYCKNNVADLSISVVSRSDPMYISCVKYSAAASAASLALLMLYVILINLRKPKSAPLSSRDSPSATETSVE